MSEHTTDTNEPDERTVLTVRVAQPDEVFDDLEERFASLDANERPEPSHEVVLQREEDLNRLLRPNNVELLRTIARGDPESIRETARLVDRDVHQVHDDLADLERMNLVQFEPNGRAKRPVVPYDDIDVELPITDDDMTAASA
ncbi:MAG: transcriptional regulator [Halobacteriales archaeon]